MSRKNCLIKISGDMIIEEGVLNWIKKLSKNYFVVICVGGGTQINEVFQNNGISRAEFGPLGRETKSLNEKQLARDTLEKNQAEIQDRLAKLGIYVNVVIPVMDIATVLCHVNGDQYLLTAYHGFDRLYVVTTKDRVKKKKSFFAPYQKIEVIGF